jgi:cystathionine beta-lyase
LKWTGYEPDVLPAWVAEMDFGLAPAVAEALHAAVDRGNTGYHYPAAEDEAAVAATGFWSDRFHWDVDPSHVFPAPDVIEGIRRAIVHLTEPGSAVVLHTPVYFPFFSMVERAGRDIAGVSSLRDGQGRYRLDVDGIEKALAAGAGSIVLCNPWNPTGRSLSEAEITEVLDVARSRGARVITDEVHGPLTLSGATHTVAANLDPELVVTVTSASKAWNLPGLKCAQVVLTNPRDREVWEGYFTPYIVGVSTFGLIANAAAYSHGREWLDGVVIRLQANRQLLDELMAKLMPGVGYQSPEATYLAWLDFTGYRLDDPAEFLLEKARVALASGPPFGEGGRGHARLNFATPAPILGEIVERMAGALDGLSQTGEKSSGFDFPLA